MTEEIIKSIAQAEAQATELKREATEKAARTIEDAEKQAAALEKSNAEVCRAYRESQTSSALEDAEKEYRAALRAKENEAKAYCEKALLESEACVEEIVGRIVRGCR